MSTFIIGDVHGRARQLRHMLEILPRDPSADTLIFLGDLIDRGEDAPSVVELVMELQAEAEVTAPVIILRGNHEQLLLDFVTEQNYRWIHGSTGSETTFEQYTHQPLTLELAEEPNHARELFTANLPAHHLEFFDTLPYFHEDDLAIYVHAGLYGNRHPSDLTPEQLIWARDTEFFRHYAGKPCIFGHTPVPLLPLSGRLGRHGIYISHHAIGIDTGYTRTSPLTCLELPTFAIYQTFSDGRATTQHPITFVPPPFRTSPLQLF